MEQKTYQSFDEAFAALSQDAQAHSGRVAEYADLIFTELLAAEEYTDNLKSRVRLREENRETIVLAAKLHDLGKVLVPEFYQWHSDKYSPEELALYRKHAAAGEVLAEEIATAVGGVTPTQVSILCEGIASHHERWDGAGFPNATAAEATPVVGRIVAAADALDHCLMRVHTETPVDSAMDELMMDSGTVYDPVIMGLLYEAKRKIAKIFSKYSEQSQAIEPALRIIRRKVKRPMWLEYRTITNLETGLPGAVEAKLCFRRGKEVIGYDQMAHLLPSVKDTQAMNLAFILDASDMLRRMRKCEVGGDYLAFQCPPGFLRRRGAASAIAKQFEQTETDPRGFCMILSGEDWAAQNPTLHENCTRLRTMGCRIMLSGVALELVSPVVLHMADITDFRLTDLDAECCERNRSAITTLQKSGIVVQADGVEKHRTMQLLKSMGVVLAAGGLMGGYMSEDELITSELAIR